MLDVRVNIESALAESKIKDLESVLKNKAGLHAAMAKSTETVVLRNLREKYVPRNKRGDFWSRVLDSVEVTSDADKAEIALTELGIGLRYHGGEVRPGKNPARSGPNKGQPTKALAVPSDSVPVKRGRQIPPGRAGLLAFLRNPSGGDTVGYLVQGQNKKITRGPNKGKNRVVPKTGGDLMYTLRRVTRHKGDKKILPDVATLQDAASDGAAAYVDSLIE